MSPAAAPTSAVCRRTRPRIWNCIGARAASRSRRSAVRRRMAGLGKLDGRTSSTMVGAANAYRVPLLARGLDAHDGDARRIVALGRAGQEDDVRRGALVAFELAAPRRDVRDAAGARRVGDEVPGVRVIDPVAVEAAAGGVAPDLHGGLPAAERRPRGGRAPGPAR